MITDDQFAAWLDDSGAQRVTLFEVGCLVGGVPTTRYFSNKAYGGGSSATPYLAIVVGGLKMTESISLVTEASLSAGDIELLNFGGEFDSYLDDNWSNQTITAWVGDVRWPRADFRQDLFGIVSDIDGTKAADRLNLILRDKFQRLNTPVTEELMGASAPNPETLRPLLLGESHNITPKLKNAATKEYEFNSVASEDVIEVRTDGKKRTTITKNLAVGSFTFTDAVGPGTVTCSAQGVKPSGTYSNRIVPLIKYLVTQCGKAGARFTDSDLDLVSLAAFDAAHPQIVGLYIPDRMNVLEACHELAGSVGAQMVPTRTGLLRLIQIAFPTSATTEIRQSAQIDGTIQLVAYSEIAGAVKIGFCRNWTQQPNLGTSLPPAHKEMFAEEWLTAYEKDDAVLAAFKLDGAPSQQNTCLQDDVEAQAEALRRLNIFKVKRKTYRFQGTPRNMMLELGQAVKLFSNRYNLAAGKVGIVTSLARDWDTFQVTVEVTI
ncbi:MAG TPA: hypothetical protein VGC21_13615 [Telluria sp.]|jgi:hypothetical protein